eukprot:TRINITY_DN4790_c0_g1_i1.p1 TRINITY_DN4790_c0_g1~~TRINITY_DN4790_c0_g1_i1.p1  ORF type:complete len:129 (+),score=21.09 TRINITY_DN4790_c0_g1_i1:203-589(+)
MDMAVPELLPDGAPFPFELSDEEYRTTLSQEEYRVLRAGGTQSAGRGEFCAVLPETGYFGCRACALPLYSAESKFGNQHWDAYSKCFYSSARSHVICRDGREIACAGCGSHLGHVFEKQSKSPTLQRH